MKIFRARRAVTVTLAAGIVLAVGGVASASIPSGDGRIQSCVGRTGAVRVIDTDAGARCATTERRLAWNQRGPAGPRGAAGPAGPAGRSTVVTGLCQYQAPSVLSAGTRLVIRCRHAEPFSPMTVMVTPVFADGYAESTYVLEPVLDYSYRVDIESGSDEEFVVLVRIMREVPQAGINRTILLTYHGVAG